jgi:predicted ribosomally synthesized peptide with nif11-like leader
MNSGFDFVQRIQEDAEFRRQVNACSEGEERLAFLKSEGYDFFPFIEIWE